MTARKVVAFLSIALVAGAVGCSSSSKSSKSTTTTTSASSAKSFEVATPEGQVSLSLDGQLPPGWPSDFPVPSGATPAGSGSLGNSSQTTMVGVFTSTGTPQSAYDFYSQNAQFPATSKSAAGVGESYAGTVKFSGQWTGSLVVVGRSSSTYIVVILKDAGTATTTTPTTAAP